MQPAKPNSCRTTASQPSRATCVQAGNRPRAPRSPWPLGPAKTGLVAGLFGTCTAFLLVQGPKPSCGQVVALWPSPAWGGPGPTYQRASKSPQPPQLANVGPGAGIFGKCTAFSSLFSFVLSCQVKNSWASLDFSTCVVPLTPLRAPGSCELPPGATSGCCTCIFQPCMGRFAPPPLTWAHDRPHVGLTWCPLHCHVARM